MTGRDRLVVIVIGAALLLAGYWFLALAPRREKATELANKVTKEQERVTKARTALTAAQDAKARYDSDYAAVAALGQAVPADDDVPSLIVQVDHAAEREHVNFLSLALDSSGTATQPSAPSAPAQAQGAAATAPAVGTEAGKDSGKDSGSSGSSATAPAAPTQAAAATLPPGASVGPAGFPTMPFNFEFIGSFFRLEDFLHRLDGFTHVGGDGDLAVRGRLLAVDSFELKAAPAGFPKIAASVKATAYVLPPGQGLTAGATAAGPAGSSEAPAPSSSSSSGDGGAPAPTAAASLTGAR